jgi:hypothetical protein
MSEMSEMKTSLTEDGLIRPDATDLTVFSS